MPLIKKILDKFNGFHYPQEYLCLASGSFPQPLFVYQVNDTNVIKDITNQHLFVGYCPLVFALEGVGLASSLQLIFSQHTLQPNESYSKKDALAFLELKLVNEQDAGNNSIYYYEGVHGIHHFTSRFQQLITRLNNEWFNKRPGNVFLHDNLYKQVMIAYAVPRIISLITVGDNNLFNLFPTDLHGQINEQYYVISLRTGGKALQQVQNSGKVLLSQVDCSTYKTVYGLGKNHMQDLRPKDQFPFSGLSSGNLEWPLPEQALLYRELELKDSFSHGIHTIMLFHILSRRATGNQAGTLAHIHNSYASWRYRNGLRGNYLLR